MSEVDLPLLNDVLDSLRQSGVRKFSGYGISVEFEPAQDYVPQVREIEKPTEVRAPTPVRQQAGTSVWEDPSLWPGQGGKRIRFDGKLE